VVGLGLSGSASPVRTAQLGIAAAFVVVTIVCWWLLARSAAVMSSMQGDDVLLALATAMMEPAATVPYLGASALMWIVMMGAMMTPAVLPITLVFARLDRERRGSGFPLHAVVFSAGYLGTWMLFALVATMLQWALHRAALLHTDVLAIGPPLAGAILVVAGAYQLTPLKEACLPREPLARRRGRRVPHGRAPRTLLPGVLLGVDVLDVRGRRHEHHRHGGAQPLHPRRACLARSVGGADPRRRAARLGRVDALANARVSYQSVGR
jgi:predicted metal-binding integral membrane protein DUF2182